MGHDRLLHHSHVITIRGDSYRLRRSKQTPLNNPGWTSFTCRPRTTSRCRLITRAKGKNRRLANDICGRPFGSKQSCVLSKFIRKGRGHRSLPI